jgi:hypothetical protein
MAAAIEPTTKPPIHMATKELGSKGEEIQGGELSGCISQRARYGRDLGTGP